MKRRLLSLTLTLLLLASLLAGCGAKTFTASEARSGVVRLLVFYQVDYYTLEGQYAGSGSQAVPYSLGSAFGVGTAGAETDTFVTNRHVVQNVQYTMTSDGENLAMLTRSNVYLLLDDYAYDDTMGLDTSRAIPCTVLYEADEDHADLAVIQAAEPVKGRMALPLLDRDVSLESGEEVYALGYPGSTDKATGGSGSVTEYAASVDKVTTTKGVVSLHTFVLENDTTRVNVIQHTATVNHGNSGGPLITTDGAVAGINTQIYGQDLSTGDSMAFSAIEIGYVQDVLDGLRISYDVYTPGSGTGWVIAVAAAVVVLAGAAAAVVLLLRRRSGAQPRNTQNTQSGADQVHDSGPTPQPYGDSGIRIQGVSGSFAGRRFPVNGQVRIGRDPAKNDLVYPGGAQGISGTHCVVFEREGQVYLKDLGSTYGTFLGSGQRLAANQPVRLQKGESFFLGSDRERFVVTGKGGI